LLLCSLRGRLCVTLHPPTIIEFPQRVGTGPKSWHGVHVEKLMWNKD
jgi:hypothetical protein